MTMKKRDREVSEECVMFLSYLNEVYTCIYICTVLAEELEDMDIEGISEGDPKPDDACGLFKLHTGTCTCVHGVCNMYYRVFSPYAHICILLLHGRHAGVQQPIAVNWEKALSPSLWGDAQYYQYKVRIY